ncbi:MAG: hypothetical protein IJV69_06790 [Kiritimatiellae bacterium]|nr:hypothetical protein [Kiritimatiellia bacterium]
MAKTKVRTKSKAEMLEGIAPAILAAAPLSASQVAAAYRFDKGAILTACRLFVQSGGKEGLRHFRSGNRIRIRPIAFEQWMASQEESTARCDIF